MCQLNGDMPQPATPEQGPDIQTLLLERAKAASTCKDTVLSVQMGAFTTHLSAHDTVMKNSSLCRRAC